MDKKKKKQNLVKPSIIESLTDKKVYILLFFFVFLLYGQSLFNKYALDDELVVHNNELIAGGFSAIPEIFTSFYAQDDKMQYGYRPIVQTTFAVEYQFFKENPFVSHLINVLLYFLTGVLLFKFLKKIFSEAHLLFILSVTLFFLAHPLHTEVVCSLKNRDELLSFLGGLAAVYLMLKFAEDDKWKYFIAANFCLWLGFFSKLSALTFLGIIPLSLYFFSKISLKRNILYSGITAFLLLLLFYLSRLMLPEQVQPFSITENPLFFEDSFLLRITTGFSVLLFYLKILFFPHPLLFFYGYDMIPLVGFDNVLVWFSIIVHAALLLWAFYKLKQKHILAFAIFYYFISISMFTNIATPIAGIVGERFAYAALLGFCIIVPYIIFTINGVSVYSSKIALKSRQKIVLLLLVFLVPYTFKTIGRNSAWYNHKTLFVSDIAHLEKSAKANSLLAGTLFKEALEDLAVTRNAARNKFKVDSAIFYYKRSVDVYPDYSPSWNNIGSIYFVFYQDYQRAIPYFIRAIETDSNYVEPYFNLGYSYELTGDTAKAEIYYLKTINKDSTYVKALSNLSLIYVLQGDTLGFKELNNFIIDKVPGSDVPFINFGNYYLSAGDTLKAVEYLEKAFEKAPSNKSLANNLMVYFEGVGNFERAAYYRNK